MSDEQTAKEKQLAEQLAAMSPEERFEALVALQNQGLDGKELGIVPGNPVTKKVVDAVRWGKKLIDNAGRSGDAWLTGMASPSRNPIDAAVAAKDKYYNALDDAKRTGKWEKNTAKVSAADIVATAQKLGTRVYTDGVAAREAKINKRVGELQPLVQAVSDSIQVMSNATDADREKRLLTARKLMIEVGKKRAGV